MAVRFPQVRDSGVDERPEDLGEKLLAGADPAVEGGPVDVERPGEGLHINAVTREKGPAGVAEGVERGGPRGRGPCELTLQRRAWRGADRGLPSGLSCSSVTLLLRCGDLDISRVPRDSLLQF